MSDPKFVTEDVLFPLIERVTKLEGRVDGLDALLSSVMQQSQIKQLEEAMALTKAETGMDGRKLYGKLRRMLGSSKMYVHELADRMVICLAEIRAAHSVTRS